MTIHPLIRKYSRQWAGSSESFPRLIQAMYLAEGGTDHTAIKAVQCSIPSVSTIDEAIQVFCRTAAHHMSDYMARLDADGFIEYLGAHWAPIGVANDPKGLNSHWVPNTRKAWRQATA